MRQSLRIGVFTSVLSVLALAPPLGAAQVSPEERARIAAEERARAIERAMEDNAREIRIFDREGNVLATVGEPAIYGQPNFSPDRTRVAVIKIDLTGEKQDLFVFDVATGDEVQITESQRRESVAAPVWSPDGTQVAYVALRGSRFGLYRQDADGAGEEELLYEHPGGAITLTDWSLDGRYLSFFSSDLASAALYLFPLEGDGEVIELVRSEDTIQAGRLSPDSRFLAYRSDETGSFEIFVRAVDPPGDSPDPQKWQISEEGGLGMVSWRRDGRELYYLGADRGVVSVQVNTEGGFEFGRPTTMFLAPDSIPVAGTPGGLGNVSRDGQGVVFAVPPTPEEGQIAIFDRQGEERARVREPGFYNAPALSPDGSRIAVIRADRQAGTVNVWTFDLATGEGQAVTSDNFGENTPLWSSDGEHVAYVSFRDGFASIYRKAWNGEGDEEQLFRYTPGAGMVATDFSPDGRFVVFDGGGVIMLAPLGGADPLEREAIEFSAEEFEVGAGRIAPNGRFMAYGSNETGRFEIYVRPITPETGTAREEGRWQVTHEGSLGAIAWRQDGRELFYLMEEPGTRDVRVMAVDVVTDPEFEVETPRILFRLPGPLRGLSAQMKNVSVDGQRFAFVVPEASVAGR